MEKINELHLIYQRYILLYDKETSLLEHFRKFISTTPEDQLYDRKNNAGHITASAIIIDVNDSKILLISHKHLKRWLQPGGHVEAEDSSILNAALRESKEEVNIDAKYLRLVSPSFLNQIPLDIDTHFIPQNDLKNEPEHYHHDFKYLFIYTGDTSISFNTMDAKDFKWESFEKLEKKEPFRRPIKKIRHLLSTEFRTKIYFEKIISQVHEKNKIYKSIVVSHIVPGSIVFHEALNKAFPIITIIPKPNSIDNKIYKKTEKQFDITHIRKEEISTPDNEIINKLRATQGEFIIFDIGGYFSGIKGNWPEDIISRIRLIVEDTENGHQKYDRLPFKNVIASVARSPLKDNEDFLVGQSILFSADVLLREQSTLIQYQTCAIFGYGKIGKSITTHLIQRGVTPMVYDINPIKRIEAFNNLATIPNRTEIIQKADVIFSATGNNCLDIEDFKKLKSGCYIFSVTSSDDEMNLKFLDKLYKREKLPNYMFKYSNDDNSFFLVNDGNAVNFIHGAIMGNFIHLVRSEMLLAINEVDTYSEGEINSVSEELRKKIADIWLKTFDTSSKKLDFIL